MALTIISSSPMEGFSDGVEVISSGPKGGKIEWCVFFARNGTIKHGYQYVPERGYHAEHLIPTEIKDAARATYTKETEPA